MELLGAATCFILAVAVHAACVRVRWGGNAVSKFFLVGALFGLPLVGRAISTDTGSLASWSAVLAYAFACELYVFLFTFVGSSISARLLLELGKGKLSTKAIEAINDSEGMVGRRLERLRAVGLLSRARDSYRVSERGRRLVYTFRVLQRFFAHTTASSVPEAAEPILRSMRPDHTLPALTECGRTGI
jgi:hypothetical protein